MSDNVELQSSLGAGTQADSRPETAYYTTYYQGPVNYISNVDNGHFGINQGYVSQHVYQPAVTASIHANYARALVPIIDASHTRNRRTSPPDSECLPGTRKAVIQRIMAWAEGATLVSEPVIVSSEGNVPTDREGGRGVGQRTEMSGDVEVLAGDGRDTLSARHIEPILWLCGPIGCGKSAISQTIAEEFERRHCLAGSFFFFRGSESRSKFGRFIVTLAAQIGLALPQAGPLVRRAMESTGMSGISVLTQLQHLVFEPFLIATAQIQRALSGRPFIVVVDGIDECEDHEDVADFITHTLEFFKRHPHIPLRFLISSRIEEHVRQRIEGQRVQVLNLGDFSSHGDISSLVHHTFQVAAQRSRIILSYGVNWPGEARMAQLVRQADGSFVFIKTLLDLILGTNADSRDDRRTPMERFNEASTMNGLDSLYTEVLLRAHHIPEFTDVVLALTLPTRGLAISDIALLLGIQAVKVVQVAVPLQSIVRVPGDDHSTPVTFFHTSLRDFLVDEGRSRQLITSARRRRFEEHIAFRFLAIHLAMGPSLNPEGLQPALEFVKMNCLPYWKAMPSRGNEALTRKLDHIFSLRDVVPSTHFLSILAFCCWELIGNPETPSVPAQSPVMSLILSTPFPYYMPWLTSEGAVLRDAFTILSHQEPSLTLSGLNRRLTGLISSETPDPSVHRHVVLQSMLFLIGDVQDPGDGSDAVSSQNSLQNSPHREFLLHPWLRHLLLGIGHSDDGRAVELEHFLRTPHRGLMVRRAAFISTGMYQNQLNLEMDIVTSAIRSRLPNLPLKANANIWDDPCDAVIMKPGGLSVIDVFNVFRHLLMPVDPESTFKMRTATVDIGDTTKLRLCSWQGENGDVNIALYPVQEV